MSTATIPDPRTNTPDPDTKDPAMTATIERSAATTDRQSGRSVRLLDVVRGEWIKFRSVRSLWITLVAAAFATIGFGMIFSATAGSDEAAPGPAAFATDPVEIALGSINLTQLIVGVIGVMVVAGEYSTGLIRTTMAAIGRRTMLVRSKAIVLAAVTAAVMSVTTVITVWAGQLVYGGDQATVSMTDPELWGVIGGTTAYLAGIALIGAALGFILRSTAGAIGVFVTTIMIGPGLLSLLPDSFTDATLKYLPSEAGSAMMSRVADPDLLSTGSAYAVFAAWVIGLLGVAAFMLRSQDA